jgi:hypothetical protein
MSALATRPGFSTASDPDDLPAVDERAVEPGEPILVGWRETALAATAVTLLNWPGWLQINRGLDPSWQAGLAIGFTHHLQWGPQLDFTYGPYGFAGFLEPFYQSTAAIAICFVFGVTWLLAYLLVGGLRRILPERTGGARYRGVAVAAVIALAIIWVSWAEARAADFVCVTGLGLALCMLESRKGAVRAALAGLLGALTGFAVLVKLNSGIILAGLLVLALIGSETSWRERWRAAGLALAAFIGVFAAAWASAGQSFGHLASFARASASLLLGYGTAMADSSRRASIPWLALAIVVVAGLVFAAAVWRQGKRQTLVAVLMLIGWSWAEVKEGFVSGNHFPLFFRMMLVAVALAALLRPQRALFAGGLALAACLTLTVVHQPRLDPLASIRSFGTDLVDLLQPGRFAHMAASTRARLQRQEPLPASTLSLLRGHTVAIEPWENMVAWADPGLRWDPEPVVQSYSAFTPYLDHKDASFLASARAPERILYWPVQTGFDFRDPFMDPPATTEAVFCHYTQLALTGPWQVLQRVPDRCGPTVTIRQKDVHFGQPVEVPRVPGKMVLASFTLSTPLLSRVEESLLKPPDTYLLAWTGPGRPVRYRFVTGTATDDHILSVPASLGYSATFTPASIRRLEISGGGWTAGQGSVKVTFRAVSISPTGHQSARGHSRAYAPPGGDGRRVGLDEYRAQLRAAEGVSSGRPVRGDGEGDTDNPAIGADYRGSRIPVRELSGQDEDAPLSTPVAVQVLADRGNFLGDRGRLDSQRVLSVRMTEHSAFLADRPHPDR